MKICKGIFILPVKGEKTGVGPGWVQGTGVCEGLRWARRGERSATRDRCAFLHVASSAAAAETPRARQHRPAGRWTPREGARHGDQQVTWEGGGG